MAVYMVRWYIICRNNHAYDERLAASLSAMT
jgi:hypothetical protein